MNARTNRDRARAPKRRELRVELSIEWRRYLPKTGRECVQLLIVVYGIEPPSLNAANKMHHMAKHRLGKDIELMLRSRGPVPQYPGPVSIDYFRTYHSKPLDETDNLPGSFKLVGDALVRLGVIEDDRREIVQLTCRQGVRGKEGPRFSVCIRPRTA